MGNPVAIFTSNPIKSVKCVDCHLLPKSPPRPFLSVASLMECLLYGYAAVSCQRVQTPSSFD